MRERASPKKATFLLLKANFGCYFPIGHVPYYYCSCIVSRLVCVILVFFIAYEYFHNILAAPCVKAKIARYGNETERERESRRSWAISRKTGQKIVFFSCAHVIIRWYREIYYCISWTPCLIMISDSFDTSILIRRTKNGGKNMMTPNQKIIRCESRFTWQQ